MSRGFITFIYFVAFCGLAAAIAAQAREPQNLCRQYLTMPIGSALTPQDLQDYEITRDQSLKPAKDLNQFAPMQGIFVTKRDDHGHAIEGLIRVLSDNSSNQIEVIGDFNDWGAHDQVHLHPDTDPRYMVGTLPLKHQMQYRLKLNGQSLLDPAALMHTPQGHLNSIFWDIEGDGAYHSQHPRFDLKDGPVAITETHIRSLIENWPGYDKSKPENTYKFIVDSGVIQLLKNWGINAIEFLPLTMSLDGDRWQLSYLTYGPFAIDSRWGTWADFAKMVDAFNGAGIGVIIDLVPGHYPQHGNEGDRELANVGAHNFLKQDGQSVYGQTESEWGSRRYDYLNPYVRRYLIDSVLNLIKYSNISGIRIDNYGGIQNLPGGREFLLELNQTVRDYAPHTWINSESFGGDSNVCKRCDWGGQGSSTHNSGDFFGFVFNNLLKRTEEIDLNSVVSLLRSEWGWREMAVLFYMTNHDEAANGRGQASGAYPASLTNGGGWQYVEGKIRAFAALAMMSGSFYLDMPQLRILQEGTFSQNPAVAWGNLRFESQKKTAAFFAELTNYYVSHSAFAFRNSHPELVNHADYDNKIISLKRIDHETGQEIYVLINLGDRAFDNYAFGVSNEGSYKVAVASHSLGTETVHSVSQGLHGKPHSVSVPHVAPYSVTILEYNAY